MICLYSTVLRKLTDTTWHAVHAPLWAAVRTKKSHLNNTFEILSDLNIIYIEVFKIRLVLSTSVLPDQLNNVIFRPLPQFNHFNKDSLKPEECSINSCQQRALSLRESRNSEWCTCDRYVSRLLGFKTSLTLILDLSLNMWHQEQTDCAVFKYSFQFFLLLKTHFGVTVVTI